MREGEYFHFCIDHCAPLQQELQLLLRYRRFRGRAVPEGGPDRPSSDLAHGCQWRQRLCQRLRAHAVRHRRLLQSAARPFWRLWRGKNAASRRTCRASASCVRLRPRRWIRWAWAIPPTGAEIKARYKDLVKRHHPDANGGNRGVGRPFPGRDPGLSATEAGGFVLTCQSAKDGPPETPQNFDLRQPWLPAWRHDEQGRPRHCKSSRHDPFR